LHFSGRAAARPKLKDARSARVPDLRKAQPGVN
jgi:hypothetical protein